MNWKIPHAGTWAGTSLLLGLLLWPLCWPLAASAQALPWQRLRTVGQGEMHWLWFKLYDATLYSQSGQYRPDHYPQALILTYARSISRQDLLNATGQEWQRLQVGSPEQRQRWLRQLASLWPDVQPGDRLGFYVDAAGQGHFWWRDKPLGTVPDPQFPAAFLAIWLADNSRDPTLTRRLRGQP